MCAAQRDHAVHGLRTEQGTVADLSKGRTSDGSALRKGETGRQAYRLEVPGAPSAAALSVVSFKAVERLGEPYVVTVALTHPLEQGCADYVGKPATFVIDPGDGTEPRTFAGCITRFTKTAETRDFHRYEIDVEPLVARLRLTRATRIYQHKTAPEIIEAILRRHGLLGHQFAFKLLRKYPQHKFRFQYQMSAPNGIGLATPDRVMVAAGKDVSVTTSSRFNVNAVRNVAIVAGEVLSLLAYRMGVKLFAVRGDVQIQAQSGAIQMASEKDTTITSSNGRVVIEAKDELLFKCGGSYLRLTCTGIEDATRGDRISKAAAHVRQGPASIPADLPVLPKPAATACALDAARTGMPFARF